MNDAPQDFEEGDRVALSAWRPLTGDIQTVVGMVDDYQDDLRLIR